MEQLRLYTKNKGNQEDRIAAPLPKEGALIKQFFTHSFNKFSRVSNANRNENVRRVLPFEEGGRGTRPEGVPYLIARFTSAAKQLSSGRCVAMAFLAFFLMLSSTTDAQWMLINQNGGSPDGSAALELQSTDRGFLAPRLTTTQMNGISSPAAGLLIYNTDSSGFFFNNGSGWASISSSGATQFAVPAGSILPFGGDSSNIPAGFLLCDGSSLDTSSYSELYAAIGSAWGASGANFNLPDLRGRFIRGTAYGSTNDPDRASRTALNTGGNTGDNVGSVQNDEFKSHNHSFTGSTVLMNSGATFGTFIQSGSRNTNNTGGNETRPINANVNYIICYSSSIAAAGTNSSVFQGSVAASQLPASAFEDSTRITNAASTTKIEMDGSNNTIFTNGGSESARFNSSGFLGLNNNNPQAVLDVAGTAIIDSLRIYNAYSFPGTDGTNGQVLQTDGSGKAEWKTLPSGADNLGNHTATTNVELNGNWLTNDGGNEGIRIANNGNVGIGTSTMNGNLQFDNGNNNRKIVLFQGGNNVHQFGGFGTQSSELIYQVPATTADHVWQAGTSTSNSTELVRFTGDGKVGLKTSNPKNNLHVNSNNNNTYIKISNSNTGQANADGLMIGNTSNAAFIRQMEAANLHIRTNDINRISIDKDGLIGFGNSSPTADFEVMDSTGALTMVLGNASNADHDIRMVFEEDGNSRFSFGYDDGIDAMIWSGAGWTANRYMSLSSGGNFGVGLNNAQNKIHAHSSGAATRVQVTNNTSGNGSADGLLVSMDATNALFTNQESGGIEFNTNGADRMLIASDGDVGLGVNPQNRFHVHSTNTVSLAQFTNSSTGSGANDGLDIGMSGGQAFIRNQENNNLNFGTNNTTRMRIEGDGDVGIGTTSPLNILHVEGTKTSDAILFVHNTSGNVQADGIYVQTGANNNPGNSNAFLRCVDGDGDNIGKITGNGSGGVTYNTTSDRRLKTKIEDYYGGLNLVMQLQPRLYERKSLLGKKEIGFIAQELQLVLPMAVSGDSTIDVKVDPMGVDYGLLTPVLTAAIQDLNKIIQAQQKQIEQLQASTNSKTEENIELKSQLDSYEQRLRRLEFLIEEKQSTKVETN